MSTFKESKIALKDLNLWSENPRFPQKYFGKPENELIDYIVSIPFYKIEQFGKQVVQDFDMPVFEKFAVYSDGVDNVVYEGNRRLTVYKLLCNPDLSSDRDVRDHFKKLKKSISITENFKIDCVISDDKDAILRYVNRKHLNNNNEVAWGDLERSNAKMRWLDAEKKDIFKSNISLLIEKMELPVEDVDAILGRGYITTFFRIVGSSIAARFFGLYFNDDNELVWEHARFADAIKVIIYDVLAGKEFKEKKFSRLTAGDIEEYLRSIKLPEPKKGGKSTDKKSDQNGAEWSSAETGTNEDPKKDENGYGGTSGAKAPGKKPKKDAKTTQRKYLIPKDCNLEIGPDKINNIYNELKYDLLLDDSRKHVPNAVGVLFRVFLEVSLDTYAEKKAGHFFKKDDSISSKISFVVAHMKAAGHPDKLFKDIIVVGTSTKNHSYLSIEKFHQYVHSTTVEPSPTELKNKWSLLQPFIQALWDALK